MSSGVGYCEVLIRPLVDGAISVDLNCTITHRSLPLVMCVRASAKVSTSSNVTVLLEYLCVDSVLATEYRYSVYVYCMKLF